MARVPMRRRKSFKFPQDTAAAAVADDDADAADDGSREHGACDRDPTAWRDRPTCGCSPPKSRRRDSTSRRRRCRIE